MRIIKWYNISSLSWFVLFLFVFFEGGGGKAYSRASCNRMVVSYAVVGLGAIDSAFATGILSLLVLFWKSY